MTSLFLINIIDSISFGYFKDKKWKKRRHFFSFSCNSYQFSSKIRNGGNTMKISTKGRYALTIMIQLGKNYENGKYLSLKEIADREKLSLKYLEKIMISLKKHDFFETSKGKEGGYKLKQDPSHYTIGEIIRAAEEDLDVVECIKNKNCPNKTTCNTYPLWKGLSDEINSYLDSKTLKEYS